MTAERFIELWTATEEVTDESSLMCPACRTFSRLARWTTCEVYCEDCGSHSAMTCPECDEDFDHVWAEPFELKGGDHA